MVRLQDYANRMPKQLSGGQRQRVAFARAVVFEPPVLLMDEPLGALDLKLREAMQLEVKRYHAQLGCTIIFVTHDQGERYGAFGTYRRDEQGADCPGRYTAQHL